jgi:TetR/AcrR family transcriptional repressor of nem operon
MGRKLAFDRDRALEKAMESFWQKGYKKTSMRELASRLGLHLGSVYNSLGTKEAVFEEALKLYFEARVVPRLQAMKDNPSPINAIEKYLANVVDECTRPNQTNGCFLLNSLHEITKINDSITAIVQNNMRRQEEAFAEVIAAGQKAGQIDTTCDAQKLGRCMVATVISMWALSKLAVPPEKIRDVKDCAIRSIRASS